MRRPYTYLLITCFCFLTGLLCEELWTSVLRLGELFAYLLLNWHD